jgi:hypothetical protein
MIAYIRHDQEELYTRFGNNTDEYINYIQHYQEYIHSIMIDDDKMTYRDAIASVNRKEWEAAIQDELLSHKKNNTWTIVKRTNGMNVIGCKWVFKRKKNVNGEVVRYKARLVAKGYKQEYGVDYTETFAPVLKYKSLRLLLALSASSIDIIIEQMDVKTAFINADVDGDIYVELPEGVEGAEGTVLRLLKALYGIKQAPHLWNLKIDAHLKSLGFKQCLKDTCIYIYTIKREHTNTTSILSHCIIIGLFVDDILVFYHVSNRATWMKLKASLLSTYEMSDLGAASHVLGMRVRRTNEGDILLDQNVYLNEKIIEFGMQAANPAPTPEDDRNTTTRHTTTTTTQHKQNKNKTPTPPITDALLSEGDAQYFRGAVGSLIYASISTRPDLTHAAHSSSRHLQSPSHSHLIAAKRMLRYVRGTTTYGLKFKRWSVNDKVVVTIGYSDADWGGDRSDRKSTTGFCVLLNNNLISWNTKKQPTVALSSSESELMAMVEVMKEVLWVKQLLGELDIPNDTPTVRVDNQSTIKMTNNDTEHDRSKHIDIKHYFVRELVKGKTMKLEWVSTVDQLADIFTKCLGKDIFVRLRDRLMCSVCEDNHEKGQQ